MVEKDSRIRVVINWFKRRKRLINSLRVIFLGTMLILAYILIIGTVLYSSWIALEIASFYIRTFGRFEFVYDSKDIISLTSVIVSMGSLIVVLSKFLKDSEKKRELEEKKESNKNNSLGPNIE